MSEIKINSSKPKGKTSLAASALSSNGDPSIHGLSHCRSASLGLSYHKKMRLRKRPEFLAAQSRGQRVHGVHMIVIAAASRKSLLRLGITASKKVGKAVDRNLVKRRLREIFRHQYSTFKHRADVVVIARQSALHAPFEDLREDFVKSLKRALDLLDKGKQARDKS